ncbi:hypothetical protein QQM79_15380 [Marinobacteraceae bacterium S3BR75-40.1]
MGPLLCGWSCLLNSIIEVIGTAQHFDKRTTKEDALKGFVTIIYPMIHEGVTGLLHAVSSDQKGETP